MGKVFGGGGGETKIVQGPSSEELRKQAEADAAKASNAKTAELSRRRRAGSLLFSGSGTDKADTSSVLAQGKARLGD